MGNEKKRHHYIPITYLNNFTDGTGRIFAYRKDNPNKPLHLVPAEIAFERYYYSQPLPDGGRDNNTLEDFFSSVESTWPGLVTALRAGTDSGFDFEALCTFMVLMRVRVPATRDVVELSLAEQVKATAQVLDEGGKLPPKPEGFEDILDYMAVSIDPHQSLHAMSSLAHGFGLVLDHLSFEVLHNKTDIHFLTSDNPIAYFNPTAGEGRVLPYQVRPPHGPIELLFPIDADTMLRGRTGLPSLGHTKLTNRQAVKRINRFIVRFGYRFVFARDRTHDALIAKFASTSPTVKSVTVPGRTGGRFTFSECVFGPRPSKPKWDG